MKKILILIALLIPLTLKSQNVIEMQNEYVNPVAGGYVVQMGSYAQSGYSCSPSGLTLTQIQAAVKLDWAEACTDEDGFEIWCSIDGAAYSLLDTVSANVETYNDSTEYAGSEVSYKVRAWQGLLYSTYTTESSIEIEPLLYDLLATWINDFSRVTFDGVTDWQTEIYSSLNQVDYTLVTTVAANTNTYDDYTWQGDTVFYKARAKSGAVYGDYTSIESIVTPLVIRTDQNPKAAINSMGNFGLPAGKTVHIDWGDGLSNDYITTQTPAHNYTLSPDTDPFYIQVSGDLNSITKIYFNSNLTLYGDLNKWILPLGLTDLRLQACAYTGNLSSWVIPASCAIVYLSTNVFTGIPRGNLKQLENTTAGLSMGTNNCSTAEIDAWLAYANTYFATNTPNRNCYVYLANSPMGIPTGGNNNTDRLAIIAKFVAAGYTITITVRTS